MYRDHEKKSHVVISDGDGELRARNLSYYFVLDYLFCNCNRKLAADVLPMVMRISWVITEVERSGVCKSQIYSWDNKLTTYCPFIGDGNRIDSSG